jgi:hypothetical protein
MSTVILKLVSGEEVIARVKEETETTITLESARTLLMQPTGPGQMGVVMLPWVTTIPEGVLPPLEKTFIMLRNDNVPKQLEDGYLQQTSGIQLI